MTCSRIHFALLVLGLSAGVRVEAKDLPVYKLKAGQELIYHTAYFSTKDGTLKPSGLDTDCHVTILRESKEKGWRLFIREALTYWSGSDKKVVRTQQNLGYGDLYPDGRFVSLATHQGLFAFDPMAFFPYLPDDDKRAARWDHEYDEFTMRYSREPETAAEPGLQTFTGIRVNLIEESYPSKWQATYTFDLARGLVVKATATTTPTVPSTRGGKFLRKVELQGVREASKESLQRLGAETEVMAGATRKYQELMEQGVAAADKEIMMQANDVLRDGCEKLTVPALRAKVDEVINKKESIANAYSGMAAERGRLIGSQSPEWEAVDIDGNPVAVNDFRGKVTVLELWVRNCGGCIKALPEIDRLAGDFKAEPVAILSVSVDSDAKAVRRVVDKLGVKCRTVLAADILAKYQVSCWPTLILLDSEGIVRDVHYGYQPMMRDKITREIRKLLTESKKGSG